MQKTNSVIHKLLITTEKSVMLQQPCVCENGTPACLEIKILYEKMECYIDFGL